MGGKYHESNNQEVKYFEYGNSNNLKENNEKMQERARKKEQTRDEEKKQAL